MVDSQVFSWLAELEPGEGLLGCQQHQASLVWRSLHEVTLAHAGAKSTKGLHVCRHLHRAGWRVVLVDVERCEESSI